MRGKTKDPSFSHDRVREVLDYNPATGVFVWKISPAKNVKAGSIAGGNGEGTGYRYIRVDGAEVIASRLAFFYVTGSWPDRRVRHKNGNRQDLRFENLTLFNGICGEFDHKSREGRLAYLKAYRQASPRLQKARSLRASFGISLEDYEQMHAAQNGLCAICGQPEMEKREGKLKALSVDHDHATGEIRQLLCGLCNKGLGKFRDSPDLLRKAAKYLERHSSAITCDEVAA